ncbi:MAG: YdcF family protein [Rhodospirillales bacterium]|nr:YdcF family protein [Rhodospirillales bacterium]
MAINGAVERVYEMAVLSRRYPKARLVFSGGSGSLLYQEYKESRAVAPLLGQLGIDPGRVIYEDQSRNTAENAVFSYRIVQPKKGETWLLVTSAFHMPRTIGSFRQVGWDVTPYPVDYSTRKTRTLPVQFNFAGGLNSLGGTVHEFLGLLFYWLDGKTDELFPGPR